MIKTLWVTDLDGTLLMPDVTVSDRSRALLTPLLKRGLPLTAATARTSFSVMPILAGLPFSLPLILQNGAVLHDPVTGLVREAAVIGAEAFSQVTALVTAYGFNGFVFCEEAGRIVCCYTELTTPHMQQYYAERRIKYAKPFRQVETLTALTERHPVFLSLHAEKAVLDPLRDALAAVSGISLAYYRDVYEPEIWYLEISAADASKYHGIKRLKALTGAETVVGFGDNLNDLPLFAACDCKIAVGNAAPELKAKADLVIGCNTEDAVAEYLTAQFPPD
ncbi:MAG: HAD family hydrolase [Oscillospiraceae bacterium]|nr:HAD-IIB family hydrolase [Oscillospiraceae bacterium]MCR5306530.1 HAD family hydrolase [Oscillospiraceae bacterium]